MDDEDFIFRKWEKGETGKGRLYRFQGDYESSEQYGIFVMSILSTVNTLHPLTKTVLQMRYPSNVFVSARGNGSILLLNLNETKAAIWLDDKEIACLPPLSIDKIILQKHITKGK